MNRVQAAARVVVLAAAVAAAGAADAQSAGPTSNSGSAKGSGTKANGRNGTLGDGNSAPAYEDRLINGGALELDISDGQSLVQSAEGWPRGARLDLVGTKLDRNGVRENENGVAVGAYLESPSHGSWTAEGTFRSDGGGTGVLWQRNLAFDRGWVASNALGTLNTPSIDLARTQQRFFLPSMPVIGAATEWRNVANVQLVGAGGEPGLYSGIRLPRFDRLDGTLMTAGASWNIASGWTGGAQAIQARNTNLTNLADGLNDPFSSRTVLAAAAWQARDVRVQGNLVNGNVNNGPARQGGWIDAALIDGRLLHTFGAFRIEPDLAWGNQAIANDMQGGYYRASYRSRQWLIDGGADVVRAVSSDGIDSTFLTGSIRYQWTRDVGAGGGLNWRNSEETAWSAYSFVERNHPWGIGRLQADAASQGDKRDVQLTYDQTWALPAQSRLSTAVSIGRSSELTGDFNRLRLSAYGGGDLTANFSVDGNVSWTRGAGSADAVATYANVGLNWRMSFNWLFSVGYYQNRTDGWLPLTVTSPIAVPSLLPEKLKDRGLFATLRFEGRAGTPTIPLGGSRGGAAGRLSGIVYLDANDDARLDAGELPVANITVVLDGRFSVRTDAQGRFDFPAVASGRHSIAVLPDNVPLPWVLPDEGRRQVDIAVREATYLELGARKLR